jgi:hypothetical protein
MTRDQAGPPLASSCLATPVVGSRHKEGDMLKVIDGKTYDTAAAEQICDVSATHGLAESHPAYDSTCLYRTEAGRYFLAGTSGELGRWHRSPAGGATGGAGIEALSDNEARLLVERHCPRELYEELFGPADEA